MKYRNHSEASEVSLLSFLVLSFLLSIFPFFCLCLLNLNLYLYRV